jgi:membrane protein required for colicin V production
MPLLITSLCVDTSGKSHPDAPLSIKTGPKRLNDPAAHSRFQHHEEGTDVLNPFDIAIIAIVCFCVIRGAFRGIIKEASSIVGVIAGLWTAIAYYPNMASSLKRFADLFPNEGYVNIVSFLIIFGAVFLVVSALGILLKYLLKIVFLAWVDKLCGACFGFVKGFAIVAMLFFVLTTFMDKGTPIVKESLLCPYVSSASETMSRFASKDMRHEFQSKLDIVKKSWDRKKKDLPLKK